MVGRREFVRPAPTVVRAGSACCGAAFTRAPKPVGSSIWMLPEAVTADDDGVVGIGADLQPATLVDAYRRGIFPWPHDGMALPWFSPDPRGIIPLGGGHVSRSLRRRLRQCGWTTTVDAAFGAVVDACSQRDLDAGTWITEPMQRAYRRLHELGWAHSIEVWEGDHLVGGLYGMQIGAAFTGESMFHRRPDASKVALLEALRRVRDAGGRLFDVQLTTGHLESMGAIDVPRERFLRALDAAGRREMALCTGPHTASSLLANSAGLRHNC